MIIWVRWWLGRLAMVGSSNEDGWTISRWWSDHLSVMVGSSHEDVFFKRRWLDRLMMTMMMIMMITSTHGRYHADWIFFSRERSERGFDESTSTERRSEPLLSFLRVLCACLSLSERNECLECVFFMFISYQVRGQCCHMYNILTRGVKGLLTEGGPWCFQVYLTQQLALEKFFY